MKLTPSDFVALCSLCAKND